MADDLEDLVSAWLGRDPGEGRREELLARLRADPEFRRGFAAEARLLGLQAAAGDDDDGRVMRRVEALGPRRRFWPVAAAAALLAAVGVAVVRTGRPDPVAAEPLAVVVAGESPGRVVSAGPFAVPIGTATLAFYTGVTLTVEGPADIELRSFDAVFCRRGRLRAEVPPGAEGFTVLTPGSAIVDRGTEFGVNVGDGRTELMVFRGLAEVSAVDGWGRPVEWEPVAAGQAVEVVAPAVRRTRPDPGRFADPQSIEPPPLPVGPDYAAAVVAAGPWGYWRFETPGAGAVPNEVPGRPPLRAQGGAAAGGGSAVFRGTDPGQGYTLAGDWIPPPGGEFTVELWALTATFRHATLIGFGRPDDDMDQQTFFIEFAGRNPRGVLPGGCAARALDRRPPGFSGGANAYSTESYVTNRWYHVVGRRAGGRLGLYLNGELVGETAAAPGDITGSFGLMLGRLAPLGSARSTNYRLLRGRLDEVAVYDRPLSPEEIRGHYELGVGGAK